jgi:putative nucleotidyltransferase with HDIG domain
MFLQFGHSIDRFQFSRMIEHLNLVQEKSPQVINLHSRGPNWPAPTISQAVIVPLTEGENLFGWLAAFNQDPKCEFGSSEVSLLSSVAAILGIHAGNLELYRQQAEFLAGVVRALTSAIDAKDPYTCGHSDRVAQIAVKLAEHLGCNRKELETVYLSGLLHDIGKIGIDDHVLRKPGKLTGAEYEHIKLHAEIGYRILKDLKQLDQVLPVVRHHHESWDGSGYPLGLAGNEIPMYARIVAVADAFDAMSSDRPYRKGMPNEKLDAILQDGAASQWDPQIIEAFFAIRDKIRRIERNERSESQSPESESELALLT